MTVVIDEIHEFSEDDLAQLAALETRCIAQDGGRLKLEYSSLRRRDSEQVNAIAIRDGEDMLAFLGIYGRLPTLEIAGMTAPDYRRRKFASVLFEAALPLLRTRGAQRALLVVPTGSGAGAAFARAQGARLEHSEHALLLASPVVEVPHRYQLSYRGAHASDVTAVGSLLRDGFDWVPDDLAESFSDDEARTEIAELNNEIVATLRVSREGEQAGIYGFVVAKNLRGKGIGRQMLAQTCTNLQTNGVTQIRLEVSTDNVHALSLYTGLGFERITGEDYWEFPL